MRPITGSWNGLVDELDYMSDFRRRKFAMNHGGGQMPALGFGTLIPDPAVTISATRNALEVGFRHFDCAQRYRNEREVGEASHPDQAQTQHGREDRHSRFYSAR
jgi:alcohol dehydrogenase (NADP+)